MDKIRSWFNKPKKEVRNLLIQPMTSEASHHDITMATETSPSPHQQQALLLNVRKQVEEEHLGTMWSLCRPQTTAPHPVRSLLQVEQVTGEFPIHLEVSETIKTQSSGPNSDPRFDSGGLMLDTCDIVSLRPTGGGSSNTSVSSPGLPVRPFLRTRDDFSLLYSAHQGAGGRRPPCSLPCSPLLRGGHWRSSPCPPTSLSPPPGLSRLWVEAALQRSKKLQQTKTISPKSKHPPPTSPQGRGRSSRGERDEEEQSDEDEEEENRLSTEKIVIFNPNASPRQGEEGQGEEQDEDSDLWGLEPVKSRYCQLMPCVCLRCPSAPPYEDQAFSAVCCLNSGGQMHRKGSTSGYTLKWVGGGMEQAPQLSDSPCLYPSLNVWKITDDLQTKQKTGRKPTPHQQLLFP